eukprot:COSAG01_NODE_966_length_12397_cov_146.646528_9_plen_61_part_00
MINVHAMEVSAAWPGAWAAESLRQFRGVPVGTLRLDVPWGGTALFGRFRPQYFVTRTGAT